MDDMIHKATFFYQEGTYTAKWDSVECIWIGDDNQTFDTLDEIRTELMHSGYDVTSEILDD